MEYGNLPQSTAFTGSRRIASGELVRVALEAKRVLDGGVDRPILIFDDGTGELVEVDFRGSADEVARRVARPVPSEEGPRGPGRPKLGVVAREVTLLPRHWEWLNGQPGGASVALRKLVDAARRENEDRDRVRRAKEAAYRFLSAMAGNEPGFEEAIRALFADDRERFHSLVEPWASDVRDHARKMAAVAFEGSFEAATI